MRARFGHSILSFLELAGLAAGTAALTVASSPARAGYDITVAPITVRFLSSDNQPVQDVEYRVYIGSNKKTFRFLGCGASPDGFFIPYPRFCFESHDLQKTAFNGALLISNPQGEVSFGGASYKTPSKKYRGAELLMSYSGFRTKRCKSGRVYPTELFKAVNEPRWTPELSDLGFIGPKCEYEGGLPEHDDLNVDFGGRKQLTCRFPLTVGQISKIVEEAPSTDCVD